MSTPGESWIDKLRRGAQMGPDGWRSVAGLSTAEAEKLLDWLEVCGCKQRELHFDPQQGFSIRWCCGVDGKANPAAPD